MLVKKKKALWTIKKVPSSGHLCCTVAIKYLAVAKAGFSSFCCLTTRKEAVGPSRAMGLRCCLGSGLWWGRGTQWGKFHMGCCLHYPLLHSRLLLNLARHPKSTGRQQEQQTWWSGCVWAGNRQRNAERKVRKGEDQFTEELENVEFSYQEI